MQLYILLDTLNIFFIDMNYLFSNKNDPKFLVDSMLGKLARFLRIFGYDTIYANDLEEFFGESPVPDDKLKQFAEENNRIIITKDYIFCKKMKGRSIYLKGEGVYNYLNQLREELQMNYTFLMERARCSVCNSIMERVKDKKLIKNSVLDETYNNYNEFYQCINPNCNKVFWNGPHILDITKKIENKLSSI